MPNLTPDQREKVFIVTHDGVEAKFQTLAFAEDYIRHLPNKHSGYSVECREVHEA